MELLPIAVEMSLNRAFAENPDCHDSLQPSVDFYGKIGFHPPWIGYYAQVAGRLVGGCAFKGRPTDGKVEIAYGTFEPYRGQGVGSEMCRCLVQLARRTDPAVRVTARTLPEEGLSTRILRKNGFVCLGELWDDEDGTVWEWEYAGPQPNMP